jgi:hypothetical protein
MNGQRIIDGLERNGKLSTELSVVDLNLKKYSFLKLKEALKIVWIPIK